MLDDKGVIQVLKPKRPEEVKRTVDPKYYRYHRMVSHPLGKCITIKEHIMLLTKYKRIILNLDNVVKTNHIFCQTKGLSIIQFRSSKAIVLLEHRLLNPITQ